MGERPASVFPYRDDYEQQRHNCEYERTPEQRARVGGGQERHGDEDKAGRNDLPGILASAGIWLGRGLSGHAFKLSDDLEPR